MLGNKNKTDFLQLLSDAAENTVQGALMFQEAMRGDKTPREFLRPLKELEDKGDAIVHHLYAELNKVFITPIDREDIMELASKLDDVMDGLEATIARFDYLNIHFTDAYMRNFAAVLVESCQHIHASFKLLSQKKYMDITKYTVKINELENEGDRLMREGIREVFTQPKDPYHDFKLKELYERLEETTDACEDVANILDSMVLRYA